MAIPEGASNRVDFLRPVRIAVATGLLLSEVLALQFTRGAREKMGRRDNWTCQKCGNTFRKGWMMHCAHYPERHTHGVEDPNIENGHVLDVRCHLIEHIGMFQEDPSQSTYQSLRLITQLAYNNGYHTWKHYADHPDAIEQDRDQVVQDLADFGLAIGKFIDIENGE